MPFRAGGNYGAGTAELQAQNYAEQQELQKKREALWRDAVGNVKAKKYEVCAHPIGGWSRRRVAQAQRSCHCLAHAQTDHCPRPDPEPHPSPSPHP